MTGEIETIRRISSLFPRSSGQVNGLQEADAEIISLGGTLVALNVDEFSEDEDLFSSEDPFSLGWNIACGVLSDLMAVAATPRYAAQSCVLTPMFEGSFGEAFFRGVSEAVTAAGAYMTGGDTSTGPQWRYTGVAIGDFSSRPVMRTKIRPGDRLYMTGTAGAGNLMALTKLLGAGKGRAAVSRGLANDVGGIRVDSIRFPLRSGASRSVGRHARACIDTSDGFARSLEILSMVNRQTGFLVAPGMVPLFPGCASAVAAAGLPGVTALLGSAGEYELLAAVSPERAIDFVAECAPDPVTLVGMAVDAPGVWFAPTSLVDPDGLEHLAKGLTRFKGNGSPVGPTAATGTPPFEAMATLLPLPLPDPRGYGGMEGYLKSLAALARALP